MKSWLAAIPPEDLATYRSAGFLGNPQIGERLALVVVDVTFAFTGDKGLSLPDAIRQFSTACGPVAWEAMPRIATLIELFRRRGDPIVFTRNDRVGQSYMGRATKSSRPQDTDPHADEFPDEIAPRDGEWVLEKVRASAFFQTSLASYLTRRSIDTVVICGVSTSGCVRATAVDAFSHGYTTLVVDDCTFDRSHYAHCANLFDMQAKYASVVSLEELEVALDPANQHRALAARA